MAIDDARTKANQRKTALDLYFHPDAVAAALAKNKAALLPPADRAELEAIYGKVIGPLIDAKLEAKARELVHRYMDGWVAAFDRINGDGMMPRDRLLVSKEEACELLGISLSTFKRLENAGELPERVTLRERVILYPLVEIEKMAKFRGAAMVPTGK